jgi:transposase
MRTYRPYEPDQILLFPPSLQDWLPEGHLARFLCDVVDELDLSALYEEYEEGDGRGNPPYHPLMMTKLILYGYCTGRFYSRQIERLTYEDVAFRYLAADQHPDHDTVAYFRERHLGSLSGLFQQVLLLCREAEEANARIEEREEAERRGRKPKRRDVARAKPASKAQRNFTDPDSRIMVDGSTKGFVQAYNAQAGVDEEAGVIVVADVVQESNDKNQLKPMLMQVEENLGRLPDRSSADSGYYSAEAVEAPELKGTDLYIATDRHKHNEIEPVEELLPPEAEVSARERMQNKLRTEEGRAVYARRKCIVEPVFGNIKEVLRFRRFSMRGHPKVRGEFLLMCAAYDLLKLFRNAPSTAALA